MPLAAPHRARAPRRSAGARAGRHRAEPRPSGHLPRRRPAHRRLGRRRTPSRGARDARDPRPVDHVVVAIPARDEQALLPGLPAVACAAAAQRAAAGATRHPPVGRGGPRRLHRRVGPGGRRPGASRRSSCRAPGSAPPGTRPSSAGSRRSSTRPSRRPGSPAPTPTPWCRATGCCGTSCGPSGAPTWSSAPPNRWGSTRGEALAAWHARHQLVEGHAHVHGANLGIRADRWRAVGGFGQRTVGEDVDLVERVRAVTGRWVATDTTRVLTSGRLAQPGRARLRRLPARPRRRDRLRPAFPRDPAARRHRVPADGGQGEGQGQDVGHPRSPPSSTATACTPRR